MKRFCLSVAMAAALVLAASPSAKAEYVFFGYMSGIFETPPNPTSADGLAVFVLTDDLTTLFWGMAYGPLTGGNVTGAHFHNGAIGSAGGVVRGYANSMFPAGGGTVSGVWMSTDAQALTMTLALELFANRIYFNIHTSQYPGGEIRGQVNYLFSF